MAELHEISLRERIRLNLLSAMDRANINQVQLAEKLGISKGTVNNWARGNNSPDVDMVPKICNVLGISILDLYTSNESEKSKTLLKNSPSADESAPGEELQREIIRLAGKLSPEQTDLFLALLRLTAARNQGLPAADLVSAGEAALKSELQNPTR